MTATNYLLKPGRAETMAGFLVDSRDIKNKAEELDKEDISKAFVRCYDFFKNEYEKFTNKTEEAPVQNLCTHAAISTAKVVGVAAALCLTPIGGIVYFGMDVINPAYKENTAAGEVLKIANSDVKDILSNLKVREEDHINHANHVAMNEIATEAFAEINASYSTIANRNQTHARWSLITKSLLSVAAVLLVHGLIALVVFHALSGSVAIFNSKALLGTYVASAMSCAQPIWIAIGTIGGIGLVIGIALRMKRDKDNADTEKLVKSSLQKFKKLDDLLGHPERLSVSLLRHSDVRPNDFPDLN